MGIVVRFPRAHARASSKAGRGTPTGQSTPSGQCSENQIITSSYLRAVKVLPSRKKRQSPAAKRPSVDKLTLRASAYEAAQTMRFDRSSDSMGLDDSRKIPTTQAVSVGNFRLASDPDKSDKSAMPTVDQIRHLLARALEKKGGPITVAQELGYERNHIRDFLEGKKRSLRTEVMLALSEYLEIPFKDLVITKEKAMRRTG